MKRTAVIISILLMLVVTRLALPLTTTVMGDEFHPKIVRVAGNEMAKRVIDRIPPEYPREANLKRIQGIVRLEVIIAVDGTPRQLKVLSGHPLLVKAALDAVRQWRYQQTEIAGEAVEVLTDVNVSFRLR